jgi:hypothetical protein
MIFLNILNFVGLSILKLIVVGLLFIIMGIALVFIALMDYLTIFLRYINSYVN